MGILQALLTGPGPENGRGGIVLYLKGVCMGVADIIPGVSGGTIALITGIYESLIAAVRSVNAQAIKRLLKIDITGFLETVHTRFLIPLMLGIVTAVLAMSRLMHFLLHDYPVQTSAFFFGLIAASIIVVGRKIERWSVSVISLLVIGAIIGYILTGLVPVETPQALWFIFLSGAVAVCAMILPGISGAYILLILGKYEFITGTLKNPFVAEHMLVIAVFVTGCAAGLAGFSRVLHYFLKTHHDSTLALLTGFMLGALRKIWPFQITLPNGTYTNILPEQLNGTVLGVAGLMIVGFSAVVLLERLMREQTDSAVSS